MEIHQFRCTLLADIVLSSNSGTEGNSETLDYIPGIKFLGILAQQLHASDTISNDQKLDLFHNGRVRFLPAFPAVSHEAQEREMAIRPPGCWVETKHEKSNLIYSRFSDLSNLPQVKELKSYSFFTPSTGLFIRRSNRLRVKSAYDSQLRKTQESQMYTYSYLPKGLELEFSVQDDVGYKDLICQGLEGVRRIGRSRTAEFGLVNIQYLGSQSVKPTRMIPPGKVRLYALTDICFYQNGLFSPQLTPSLFLPDALANKASILPRECYIQTRSYHVWNSKRNTPDALRQVIAAGSVISFSTTESIDAAIWEKGIGVFRQEGLGQVLVNPAFLEAPPSRSDYYFENSLPNANPAEDIPVSQTQTEMVLGWLKQVTLQTPGDQHIDRLANEFVREHERAFVPERRDTDVKPSQWGTIRSLANQLTTSDELLTSLFNTNDGILIRGQSEPAWRRNERAHKLKKFLMRADIKALPNHRFLQLVDRISNQISKQTK